MMDSDAPDRQPVFDQLQAGIARFPAPALLAFIAAGVSAQAIISDMDAPHALFATLAAFFSGLAAALLLEGRWRGTPAQWAPLVPAALAAVWIATRPTDDLAAATGAPLVLAGMAAVVFALTRPGRMDRAAGWGALREDVLSALLALAVAFAACVGLSAALGLLSLLIDDLSEDLFSLVWFGVMLCGAPLIWFARMRPLDAEPAAPGGFYRGVTLWLLGPLTVVYLVTLHGLALKLFPDLHLPDGATGWVVAPFLAVAAVTLHALSGLAQSPLLARILYWSPAATLAPAAVMLIAAGERIDAYGLTEPRIFLALLGFWAIAMALGGYFWRPLHSVRAQAGVLVALLAIAAIAATPLSIASQRAALDGVTADEAAMKAAGYERLSSIARFLEDRDAIAEARYERVIAQSDALRETFFAREQTWCRRALERDAPDFGVLAIEGYQTLLPTTGAGLVNEALAPEDVYPLNFSVLEGHQIRMRIPDGRSFDFDLSRAAAAALARCDDPSAPINGEARLAKTGVDAPIRAALVIRELFLSRKAPDMPWGVTSVDGVLLIE